MADDQPEKKKVDVKKLPRAGRALRLPRVFAQPAYRIAKPPTVRPPARPAK